MRLILEEQEKHLLSFINDATYYPMMPGTDVTYQTDNLFSFGKCFIYFISDFPHYITFDEISNVCIILVKVDVHVHVDICGAMICSYFGMAIYFL